MKIFRYFVYTGFIILSFFCSHANGQENNDNLYNTTNIQTENELKQITSLDGMQGETVFKIFKDSHEIIWLGTNNGVSCYNGHTLINFSTDCDKYRNTVYDIVEMPDGRIMAGMRNGLYWIDKQNLECKRICEDIEYVNSLCIVNETLLIGSNSGLYIYKDDNNAEIITIESSIISRGNAINDIIYDEQDGAWLCTNERIIHFDLPNRKMQKYDVDKSILTGYLGKICLINQNLYIGTNNSGLLKFDPLSGKTSRYIDIQANVIADLNTDKKGFLYVATNGNGAYTINTKTDSIVAEYHSTSGKHLLPSDAIYTYWRDNDANINWFGFYLEGFCHNYHRSPKFSIYAYKNLDTRNLQVRSFCIYDDDIAIGTRNGLYFVSEKRDIIKYYNAGQIGGNIVTNIKFFSGHFVIANYECGLSILNPHTLELQHLDGHEALRSGNFSKVCPTPDGKHLFAISNMGVLILDEDFNVIRHFNSRNSGLPDVYLSDILFDKTGKAWISSITHLAIYDPLMETIQSTEFPKNFFNEEPNLHFNLCSNGDVMAFSETSVYRSSPDLSHYEELDIYNRLNLGNIAFIAEIDNKYWMGADKGLFLFDNNLKHYYQFNEAHNLPSLRFNQQEYQCTENGTLWFGNGRGLLYVTPKQQASLTRISKRKIIIDRISIDDRDAGAAALLALIDNNELSIEWNFISQKLSIYPLLLNYGKTRGRYYEWSIDGKEYRSCTDGIPFTISNLSSGSHKLKIRIAGHETTATTYTINVIPSLLFIVEIVMFVILLLMIRKLIRMRKRQTKLRLTIRHKHKMEMEIAAARAVEQHKREEERRRIEENEAKIQALYQKAKLPQNECKELYQKVKQYMDKEKAYKNPSIRITDIAAAVESTPAKLSQMLNQYVKQNFFDFINSYRVEEFKRMIKDEKYNQYTVTAISEMCGFKRSSFFVAFKKFEGCTPNEYLNNAGINRK